jgi:hypothetical protein
MASTEDTSSVRRYIYGGSTRSGSLSTADIDSYVDENSNTYLAAAAAADAEALLAMAGGKKKVGDLEIDVGATAPTWLALAKKLRVRGIRKGGVTPFSGGISLNDKANNESDTDWNQTAGKLGQFDYRGDGYST